MSDLVEESILGKIWVAKERLRNIKTEEFRQKWVARIKELEEELHIHRVNKFLDRGP